jgi:hypothetical protein
MGAGGQPLGQYLLNLRVRIRKQFAKLNLLLVIAVTNEDIADILMNKETKAELHKAINDIRAADDN